MMVVLIAAFLFLAVRIPSCTSDIVFSLLFSKQMPDIANAKPS